MWPFNPYLKKPLTIWRWATWVITHQPNPHDLQAVLVTFLFLVPPFRTLRTFGWSSCFSSPTPPFPSPSPIFSCSRTMAAVRPLKPSFLQVPQPPKMKRQLRHPKTWSGKILYRQDLPSPTLSWTGLVRLVFLGFWWELSTSWGPSAATLPRRVLGGTAEASVEPAELDLFFLPFPLDFPPFFAFEPFFLDPFLEPWTPFSYSSDPFSMYCASPCAIHFEEQGSPQQEHPPTGPMIWLENRKSGIQQKIGL